MTNVTGKESPVPAGTALVVEDDFASAGQIRVHLEFEGFKVHFPPLSISYEKVIFDGFTVNF